MCSIVSACVLLLLMCSIVAHMFYCCACVLLLPMCSIVAHVFYCLRMCSIVCACVLLFAHVFYCCPCVLLLRMCSIVCAYVLLLPMCSIVAHVFYCCTYVLLLRMRSYFNSTQFYLEISVIAISFTNKYVLQNKQAHVYFHHKTIEHTLCFICIHDISTYIYTLLYKRSPANRKFQQSKINQIEIIH